jgi:hypothetical protein
MVEESLLELLVLPVPLEPVAGVAIGVVLFVTSD